MALNLDRLKARLGIVKGFNGRCVQVGFGTAAKYEDGTPVAYVAVIQENGSPAQGIPPRPFFTPAINGHKKDYVNLFNSGLKKVIKGQWTADDVFDAVGYKAEGDITESIRDVTSPPLAASTVKRKGFDKPLIDTGLMVASVSHAIAKPGAEFTGN